VRPGVRLLVLDIDGTLLTSGKVISPRTRAAVQGARERGVHLALATGRRYPSALPVARELGGFVSLVLHNGALVIEGEQILRSLPLPREVAGRAVAVARAHGHEPVIHAGQKGEGLLLVEAGARRAGLVSYYLERSREYVREVEDATRLAEDPMQVMVGGPPEAMRPVLAELRRVASGEARIERTTYPRTKVEILDVLHPGVGKAGAVAFLQERHGITPAQTLAIGDNWNDSEMLQQAGLGFVMGGGDPELERLGLPMLPSSDEDGVAVAIEEHVLADS
jgi:Cof subfamily protein (haloacid dehalogenase superfamily)